MSLTPLGSTSVTFDIREVANRARVASGRSPKEGSNWVTAVVSPESPIFRQAPSTPPRPVTTPTAPGAPRRRQLEFDSPVRPERVLEAPWAPRKKPRSSLESSV